MADPQSSQPYARRVLPDPRFATSDVPPPPDALQPPQQAAQPLLTPGESHSPPPQEPDYGYGFRYNSNQPKGLGYLGTLKRPDHTGVMGEYSIDEGQGEIPSMVPTLTREEIDQILASHEGEPLPPAIRQKATAFAEQRRAAGLPVFARAGEQDPTRYPDIPRDAPVARPPAPPMAASHTPSLQPPQQAAQPPLAPSHAPPPPPSAWEKATSIGPAQLGDHYVPPGLNEILGSSNPLGGVAEHLIGPARPRSVAATDPYGITAWEQGKGPMPIMVGATKELLDPSIPAHEVLDRLTHVVRTYPEIAQALLDERSPAALDDFGQGLGQIARGMIPTEEKGVYRFAPSVRARLAHFFELGKASMSPADWSAFTEKKLMPAFANDPELAKLFSDFWGAASQGTGVGQNTGEASSAWHFFHEHGRLPTYEEALHQGGTKQPLAKIGLPSQKLPNIQRAIEGLPLEGPKIQDMAAFTKGTQASPLDRHLIYILGGNTENMGPQYSELRKLVEGAENIRLVADKVIDSPWGPVTGNEYAYRRVAETLQRELQQLAPDMPHNPIFSTVWEGGRIGKGLPAYGGPADIFARKGLLAPGAMLNQGGALERALQGHGGPWTQKLVLALLAGAAPSLLTPGRSGAAPDARGPSGPPVPGPARRDSSSPR